MRTRPHYLLNVLGGKQRGRYENQSFIPIDAGSVKHGHVRVVVEVRWSNESLEEGYRPDARSVMVHSLQLASILAAHHGQKARQYGRIQLIPAFRPSATVNLPPITRSRHTLLIPERLQPAPGVLRFHGPVGSSCRDATANCAQLLSPLVQRPQAQFEIGVLDYFPSELAIR